MGQVWVWRSGTASFKDRKGGQFLPCGTAVWVKISPVWVKISPVWVKIKFKIQNF
jgi:hypothetical protein